MVCSPAAHSQSPAKQSAALLSARDCHLTYDLLLGPFQLTIAYTFISANCSDHCVHSVKETVRDEGAHKDKELRTEQKERKLPTGCRLCKFTISVMSKTSNHFRCYLKAGDMRREREKLLTFDPSCRYEMLLRKERERIRGCIKVK